MALTGGDDPFDAVQLDAPDEGRSLVDWAHATLKELILRNQLRPGFQVLEAALAERLGISRTPMREALLRLQVDGLVELTPRRGLRVLPLSAGDLREIYQLLCCLEASAAELAAGRGLDPALPEIAALFDTNAAMRLALADGDLERWAQLDDRFHRGLVALSGNRRLQRVAGTLWVQSHRARMVTMPFRPPPVHSCDEHRAVVEAILRGDGRVAYELHNAHRRRGMALILGLIETHGLAHL